MADEGAHQAPFSDDPAETFRTETPLISSQIVIRGRRKGSGGSRAPQKPVCFAFHKGAGVDYVEGNIPQVDIRVFKLAFIQVEHRLIQGDRDQGTENYSPAFVTYRERKHRLKRQRPAFLVVRPRQVSRELGVLQVEVETRQGPGRVGQFLGDLIG
jgi:hypothetical protein